jgi:hypothetical protein
MLSAPPSYILVSYIKKIVEDENKEVFKYLEWKLKNDIKKRNKNIPKEIRISIKNLQFRVKPLIEIYFQKPTN